jgi:hypothetical protein
MRCAGRPAAHSLLAPRSLVVTPSSPRAARIMSRPGAPQESQREVQAAVQAFDWVHHTADTPKTSADDLAGSFAARAALSGGVEGAGAAASAAERAAPPPSAAGEPPPHTLLHPGVGPVRWGGWAGAGAVRCLFDCCRCTLLPLHKLAVCPAASRPSPAGGQGAGAGRASGSGPEGEGRAGRSGRSGGRRGVQPAAAVPAALPST